MVGGGEDGSAGGSYTCACGRQQEAKRRQFAGKCPSCRTKPKFFKGQTPNDGASGAPLGSNEGFNRSTNKTSGRPRNHTRHNSTPNFPSSNIMSTSVSTSSSTSPMSANTEEGEVEEPPHQSSDVGEDSSRSTTEGVAGESSQPENAVDVTDDQRTVNVSSDSTADVNSANGDPPPYSLVEDNSQQFTSRREQVNPSLRRTDSESWRKTSQITLPPPYQLDEQQQPPSYEEALALSMARTTIGDDTNHNNSVNIPIASTVLQEQSLVLEAQRESRRALHCSIAAAARDLIMTPIDYGCRGASFERTEAPDTAAEAHRLRREAQLREDLERDLEIEEDRMRRNLQVAQYCGCTKCRNLYYSYYYTSDASVEASPFPIETQVLMQEVLADGVTFCSLM